MFFVAIYAKYWLFTADFDLLIRTQNSSYSSENCFFLVEMHGGASIREGASIRINTVYLYIYTQ